MAWVWVSGLPVAGLKASNLASQALDYSSKKIT